MIHTFSAAAIAHPKLVIAKAFSAIELLAKKSGQQNGSKQIQMDSHRKRAFTIKFDCMYHPCHTIRASLIYWFWLIHCSPLIFANLLWLAYHSNSFKSSGDIQSLWIWISIEFGPFVFFFFFSFCKQHGYKFFFDQPMQKPNRRICRSLGRSFKPFNYERWKWANWKRNHLK